ncbi:hypothetical protein PsorP6_007641 [Peronosclerospora sorghi]|uniref:Uncharacterized protein n=1 Tax=Peronosclerospora sorghi TaxID=230839 RepID=A0ACC0W9R8_9STRA|nr:hypothetical protein PsorP6_007641 [Peronosclerospora sorghi]
MIQDNVESDENLSPGSCDVCAISANALRCGVCDLYLCIACSHAQHQSNLHVTCGRFQFVRRATKQTMQLECYESSSTASPPDSPAALNFQQSRKTDELCGFDDALEQSLRALTVASDEENTTSQTAIGSISPNERRPRSYSDYAEISDTPKRWRGNRELTQFEALWDAMRTDFASRHVVVRCGAGTWDTQDVRRIVDRLSNFGTLACTRGELTAGGLLFCTFFDLTSAVAAVDRWRADTDVINYCFPYELPDHVNSATLLIHFTVRDGPPMTAPELRQICACFGHVANVVQPDMQVAKFIVEYSDARALPAALNGLPRTIHMRGSLSVARTTSATLDVPKLKLFQECLNRVANIDHRVVKTRPKSFSSSSASLMTSPTSSVASSLNASFLDGASNNSPRASSTSTKYPGGGELTSRVLMPQEEQQIWARPGLRTRSNSSSAYLGDSLSSCNFDEPSYSNRLLLSSHESVGVLSSRANGISSFQSAHHLQPSNNQLSFAGTEQLVEQSRQAYYQCRGRQRVQQTKLVSMRSNHNSNTRFFRTGIAHSGGHAIGSSSTAHLTNGRSVQDASEFTLSIDKVASGEDERTTLMIRNIPNKYTQQMLLAEINRNHDRNYDFFYLPIDFKNKCNMGYAFINFIRPVHIKAFYQEFDGQKWTNFNSEKVCAITYARLQGKQAMITRFQNSSLMEKHESYRPLVFGSSGPNRGRPELFPASKQYVRAEGYGNYVTPRMYSLPPPQQHQHVQKPHSLNVYPQQLVGIPLHAIHPFPAAHALHFGSQPLPAHCFSAYQPTEPPLVSPFLYGVPEVPSNALDYTH